MNDLEKLARVQEIIERFDNDLAEEFMNWDAKDLRVYARKMRECAEDPAESFFARVFANHAELWIEEMDEDEDEE